MEKIGFDLREFQPFAKLKDDILDKLIKDGELCTYSIGGPISTEKVLQNRVHIILEGEARLIGQINDKSFTISRLKRGSLIGALSLMRGRSCEEVSAASNVVVISISDERFMSLYEQVEEFKDWYKKTIFDVELIEVSKKINDEGIFSMLSLLEIYRCVKKSSIVSKPEEREESKYKYICYKYDLSSVNACWKKTKDLNNLPANEKGLCINISELNILQAKKIKDHKNSDAATQNKFEYESLNKGTIYPEATALKREEKDEKKYRVIKGEGLVNETSASMEMLASRLDIPFRRDSIKRLISEGLSNCNSVSIEYCGTVAAAMGLSAYGTKLSNEYATRIQTPAIIKWGNSIALIETTNAEGITLVSPKDGRFKIKKSELISSLKDELEVLIVEKNKYSPEKKFQLSWFWPAIKKYRNTLIQVLIASFIVQLFGLANPLLIQVIIDKVISQRSMDTLQVLGIALVAVTIFGGIISALRTFLFTETTNRIDTSLGAEVIDHLLRLPLNYFDKRPVGELGTRIAELEKIRNFLTGQAMTTSLDTAYSLIYIAVMLIYSPLLTLIALAVVPLQIILTLLGAPVIRKQIRNIAEKNAKTQSHLIEILTGIQTVKAQNVETVSRWKWQDLYRAYISKTFSRTLTSTTLSEISNVLQQLSQLLVLWVGASLVLEGRLTLGQLIAFRIISGYVTQPLLRLSSIWQSVQELRVSFERLADIIDTNQESGEEDKNKIPLPRIQGSVKFENTSFSFSNNGQKILNSVNLEISQGTFVGIVGQSGSGKSTLMKLLSRLYNIDSGCIKIDGIDISKVELYSLRKQIGIVPQEPLLFAGNVSSNIALTDPDSQIDDIIEAARLAEADDFIMSLPLGYNTNVGERGSSLSGGQRQRIAIARTLLSKPRLLILDEATSALDYNTERKVCENLRRSTTGTTVFFITHRLSTIKNADKIVMMESGSIAEVGSHDELMAKKGRYYALYRQQGSN